MGEVVGRGDNFPDPRPNAAVLHTHARERVSVQRRPGGACTPLYAFTRIFAALLDNGARRGRFAEYASLILAGASEQDAANAIFSMNFGGGGGGLVLIVGGLVLRRALRRRDGADLLARLRERPRRARGESARDGGGGRW